MMDTNKKKVLEIMDRLINHPISNFFNDPVIPGVDSDADYADIIKNPQDLKTIRRRVENNEYSKLTDWMKDVEAVWNNAEIYNGTDSGFAILSREMRRVFNKECGAFSSTSTIIWSAEVYRYRLKFEKLLKNSPRQVHSKIPSPFRMELPNVNIVEISEHEIQCLRIALEMIKGPETSKEILRIIREMQPTAEDALSKTTLDIGVLRKPTIEAIQTYAKQAIENMGLKYPE